MRRRPKPDATEEVQVEDILLEAYADEPPPSSRVPPLPAQAAQAAIASAIASVVPPPPSQSAAVDELLRASDPAFAVRPPQGQGLVVPMGGAFGAYGAHEHRSFPALQGYDVETPSVSPMMLATTEPPAPPGRPVIGARRMNRGLVLAIWSLVLAVVGVAAGAAIVTAVQNGTYARLRDSAKSAAARASTKPSAPITEAVAAPAVPAPPPVAVAPPPAAVPAPAPPAPPAMPTVSVDSLPKPSIPADVALVTFPAYAHGHRVFVDGRVVAVSASTPTKVKCGLRTIKIGSARKARAVDLACGREVTLP